VTYATHAAAEPTANDFMIRSVTTRMSYIWRKYEAAMIEHHACRHDAAMEAEFGSEDVAAVMRRDASECYRAALALRAEWVRLESLRASLIYARD
jgi:hypothetical protein